MATFTPSKTDSVVVMTHQLSTHPTTLLGSDIDVRTKKQATIFMYHGPIEAAANDNPGKFMVQIRPDAGDSSVDEHWITVAEYVTKDGTPDAETLTAIEAAGVNSMAVASTTDFIGNETIYLHDIDTLGDSEWAFMHDIVTNTSLELADGLTNEKSTAGSGCVAFTDASEFVCSLDLSAVESFRVLWVHEPTSSTGADSHVKAFAITHDSDTSA